MSGTDPERVWCLESVTPLWTGDADRGGNRLIPTGLMGSLRWWFEVVIRGLGGSACDPSFEDRRKAPKASRCPDPRVPRATDPQHHCVVCEIFGCTGWARKFRLQVIDANGKPISSAIHAGTTFCLRFVPLHPIREEEWALLDLTLRLIADYSALGGRTVFKPSNESSRASAQHHRDYGIVKLADDATGGTLERSALEAHARRTQRRKIDHGNFAWASLQNFWCVNGKYLARANASKSAFNRVVGRDERKTCQDCGEVHTPPQKCSKRNRHPRRHSDKNPTDPVGSWLAGRQGEGKRVYSFKNPPRTFGFVKPGTVSFDQVRRRLRGAWPDLRDDEFLEGSAILDRLMSDAPGSNR